LALLRSEVREDLRKTRDAALPIGLGGLVALLGGGLLTFLLVHLLHWATDFRLALWACFGIVGGGLAVLGAVLIYMGKKRFDAFNPLPDETAQALKENIQWITKPTQSASK